MEPVDWQVNKAPLECAKYMLENQVNCDVNFKVGNEKEIVKAHKFILSMRSPVFERMFNGSFCETKTDPVIPDVSPAAFRTLLRYCYYECLDIEGDVALLVLYAAKKYMLPILERAARKTLIEKLDLTRIWQACKYSGEVGDEELQLGCSTYFKRNLKHLNIFDVTRYAVGARDKELRACCNDYLKNLLTASNIWTAYNYAINDGDEAVHQLCKEFFEKDIVTVTEALRSKDFLNISHQMLTDILHINDDVEHTPGISISEIEIFAACNSWADAECLRKKIDQTGANKRTVLGECLFLIRFPTMLQKDLLTVVYTTGILTQDEIVNLGRKIHKVPGSECQINFPSKEREFVVTPPGNASSCYNCTVHIESKFRVMLSRVLTLASGSYKITIRDEKSQRSWSMVLDTKHEKHVAPNTTYMLHYLQLESQVLEAGITYSVTAEYINGEAFQQLSDGKYERKLNPYKEVKINRGVFGNRFPNKSYMCGNNRCSNHCCAGSQTYRDIMWGLTLYFV